MDPNLRFRLLAKGERTASLVLTFPTAAGRWAFAGVVNVSREFFDASLLAGLDDHEEVEVGLTATETRAAT